MDENLHNTSAESGKQALYAQKFVLLREKLTENYQKGCRYLRIAKIVSAVLFVLFTAVGVYVSGKTGAYMLWLVLWIVLIFLNVGVLLQRSKANACSAVFREGQSNRISRKRYFIRRI